METGAKAILLKYKTQGTETFALLVMSAAKKMDSKAVKKLLATKSTSFATPEEVCEVLENNLSSLISL